MLVTTILASSLAFVDGSVVNVALAAIAEGFHATGAELQWVIDAYLLPLSALLLLGGAAGDHFGHRRMLMLGTTVFALASLACALSPNFSALVASRALQGLGAAVLLPNSLAILGQYFVGEIKGRAVGIWAASGAALAAIGPVLGGWLIDLGSWRTIFLINLPLAAAAICLAWRFVPADGTVSQFPLDWLGGALVTAGMAALTWALTEGSGGRGWTPSVVSVAMLSAGLLLVYLRIEKLRGDQAMMPLALFASRTFVGLTLFTFLLYGAMGELFVLVPYALIKSAGYSAVAAGAALLPMPLMLSATSPIAGALAARVGARLPLTLGPIAVAGGFLLALRIGMGAHYWRDVLPMIAVAALGMSAAVAPLTTAVLNSVDSRHTGSASGLNSAVARSGGLFATALLGTVLAAQGIELLAAFHTAMLFGAIACALAALSAYLLLPAKL